MHYFTLLVAYLGLFYIQQLDMQLPGESKLGLHRDIDKIKFWMCFGFHNKLWVPLLNVK